MLEEILSTFRTQEQAVDHLERVRWSGKPWCPYCGGNECGRHASGDRKTPRWQCHECGRAFSVTVGTPFHGTHVPLRDWYLLAALTLQAKPGNSIHELARDVGKRRATVSNMVNRIRTAVAHDPAQRDLLRRLIDPREIAQSFAIHHGNLRTERVDECHATSNGDAAARKVAEGNK